MPAKKSVNLEKALGELEKLVEELDTNVRFPGLTNAWVMPIKNRIDMLATGIKTPVGIKVAGPDLPTLQKLGEQIEAILRDEPGTLSVFAERVAASARASAATPSPISAGIAVPALSASTRARSSITGPRAVLMMHAVDFICSSCEAPIMWRVSSLSAT